MTFGKLNAADGVNIHPFLGGNGINRFMNEAFVLSPIYGRTIPYSTPGPASATCGISTPSSPSSCSITSGRPDTSGVSHMFSNGVTLFGHLRVPVTPFGLPGHQSVERDYASGRFSPLSEDDYIILTSGNPGAATVGLMGGRPTASINSSSSMTTTRPRAGGSSRTSASPIRPPTRSTGS